MISQKSLFFVVISILYVSGCATLFPNVYDPMTITMNSIKDKGQVLKEYKSGQETYLIMQEADNLFVKYRVKKIKIGINEGVSGLAMYTYDSNTEICFAGGSTVSCENVKKDPDMKNYIK